MGTCKRLSEDDWSSIILPKLNQFELLLWREIERLTTGTGHQMHHSMPLEAIHEEAQDRLIEIDKVNDDIYRFRLGNLRRLWGFRIVNVFEILWYDPKHKIYPTEPD
jgi:hypothetical protein